MSTSSKPVHGHAKPRDYPLEENGEPFKIAVHTRELNTAR